MDVLVAEMCTRHWITLHVPMSRPVLYSLPVCASDFTWISGRVRRLCMDCWIVICLFEMTKLLNC